MLQQDPVVNTEELQKLLAVLGVPLPKEVKLQPVTEYKVYKGTTVCALCKTVTVQYIKLAKQGGAWRKVEDLAEAVNPDEIYSAKVLSCYNCEMVLLTWDKKDLVGMILRSFAPVKKGGKD